MLEIDFNHSDEELRKILDTSRVVAMVGESNDHYYTSYQVAQYLKEMGYQVYPINPKIKRVDGDRSYPSLADVPEPIDIVDVFRKPMYLDEIVDAAIAVGATGCCFKRSGTGTQGKGGRTACSLEPLQAHRARTAANPAEKPTHKNEQPLFESMSRVHKTRWQKGKV